MGQDTAVSVKSAFTDESNDAATDKGWKRMSEARGEDDPRFKTEMFKLYDKKHGTNHVGVEAGGGRLGFLDFHDKDEMMNMIKEARDNVVKSAQNPDK